MSKELLRKYLVRKLKKAGFPIKEKLDELKRKYNKDFLSDEPKLEKIKRRKSESCESPIKEKPVVIKRNKRDLVSITSDEPKLEKIKRRKNDSCDSPVKENPVVLKRNKRDLVSITSDDAKLEKIKRRKSESSKCDLKNDFQWNKALTGTGIDGVLKEKTPSKIPVPVYQIKSSKRKDDYWVKIQIKSIQLVKITINQFKLLKSKSINPNC